MKTYIINGIEINKLLTTIDMTQSDRNVRHCFNSLLEALGTPVEKPKELTIEERKPETLEEKKAGLEEGWEEQENIKYMSPYIKNTPMGSFDKEEIYFLKQKTIAKLNTVIDKLNKEQGWGVDWTDEDQRRYVIEYKLDEKSLHIYSTYSSLKFIYPLNYMSRETAEFIIENYKEELETLFEVK